MSNRKDGTDFERELCQILREYGFWSHNFAQSRDGQPADIIAVRNGKAYLIDAKVCKNDTFALSRIEENQRWSMDYFRDCGNEEGWFALKTSEGIYMIPLSYMKTFEAHGFGSIGIDLIQTYGREVESWSKFIAV